MVLYGYYLVMNYINILRQFLKECPYWISQMSQGYEYVYNFVDNEIGKL